MINLVVICGITLLLLHLLLVIRLYFDCGGIVVFVSYRITAAHGFCFTLAAIHFWHELDYKYDRTYSKRDSFDIGRTRVPSPSTAWGASIPPNWLLRLTQAQLSSDCTNCSARRIQLSFGSGQSRITARLINLSIPFLISQRSVEDAAAVCRRRWWCGPICRWSSWLLLILMVLSCCCSRYYYSTCCGGDPTNGPIGPIQLLLLPLLLKLLLRCPSGTLKTDLRALINFNIASMACSTAMLMMMLLLVY